MEEALTIKTENYKSLINAKKMKENMDKEQLAKKKILNEVKQEELEFLVILKPAEWHHQK